MIEIQKNIPIPSNASGTKKEKYPFSRMNPGDSFLIPDVENMNNCIAAVKTRASQLSLKIVFAPENKGLRVWLREKKKD